MPNWSVIAAEISKMTGLPIAGEAESIQLTGDTSNTAILRAVDGKPFFVKWDEARRLTVYVAEAEGLAALADSHTVRVPQVLCHGVAADNAFLVLEHLELAPATELAQQQLGRQLAMLHRKTGTHFGWHSDNTIGRNVQPNQTTSNWLEFWRNRRLGVQLDLARRSGISKKLLSQSENLLERLAGFFQGYTPQPSLLHGDLWHGNAAQLRDGEPVVFDPAVYFGDRETDIAMTELFGGFSKHFYRAYNDVWPLDAGYPIRRTLYNLYHVLNHANLFGAGYWNQAEHMTTELLAQID